MSTSKLPTAKDISREYRQEHNLSDRGRLSQEHMEALERLMIEKGIMMKKDDDVDCSPVRKESSARVVPLRVAEQSVLAMGAKVQKAPKAIQMSDEGHVSESRSDDLVHGCIVHAWRTERCVFHVPSY